MKPINTHANRVLSLDCLVSFKIPFPERGGYAPEPLGSSSRRAINLGLYTRVVLSLLVEDLGIPSVLRSDHLYKRE